MGRQLSCPKGVWMDCQPLSPDIPEESGWVSISPVQKGCVVDHQQSCNKEGRLINNVFQLFIYVK